MNTLPRGLEILLLALNVAPERVFNTLLPAFVDDLEDSDMDALLALFPNAPEGSK